LKFAKISVAYIKVTTIKEWSHFSHNWICSTI